VGGRRNPQEGRAGFFCCMGQGCSQLQITPMAFPRELLKMEFPEGEGGCLLKFLLLVCWVGSGTFPRALLNWSVEGGDDCREEKLS